MRAAIGIDVGSTTAKVVARRAGGEIAIRACERHRGRPGEVARALLDRASRAIGHDAVALGATGSAGVALASALGATPVHEVSAVARAVRTIAPETRTVIELGGQDAKIIWLDGGDAEMNDRCAAGTGATIDRIARRIGLDEVALAGVTLEGDARVAAKCGVFAETDVVNLVQRGVLPAIAIAALARAIVVQSLAVLARGRTLHGPVLLLGGPHAHLPFLADAWRDALREAWARRGVPPGAVTVPPHADTLGALGAALHAALDQPPLAMVHGVLGGDSRSARALLADDRDHALLASSGRPPVGPMRAPDRAWIGLDAGSTSTKAVLIDAHGEICAASYAISSGDPIADARARISDVLAAAPRASIAGLGVTGYGAEIVAEVFGADASVVETFAHALAAERAMPGVEVVVDVGGTDVKVLRVRDGRPFAFHLSSQCSAGHGAFLATAAADLGVTMERFAEHALAAARAPAFTVGCAIFLDTDRITFQRDGWTPGEILAGLAAALPRNVWEMIVGEPPARLGRSFLLTGGAHRNRAAVLAHARYLVDRAPAARVAVHPRPELCGALGAALTVLGEARPESRFRGVADRVWTRTESGGHTRCDGCELACSRTFLRARAGPEQPERVVVLGNACERGADVASSIRRTAAHAVDLLAEESRRLFAPALPTPTHVRLARAPVIGIPRVMALYRCAPFLLHYLRAAGVPPSHIELSPPTTSALFHEGARWAANDPCFPAKLVPAHVDWLLRRDRARKLDAVLLPTFTHAAIDVHGVADTASCPIVAGCGHAALASMGEALAARSIRALSPLLTMNDRARLDVQMRDGIADVLGIDGSAHTQAFEHAIRAQAEHTRRLRARGERVLARTRAAGRAAAVVLARPYHADPGVQHGVSTELAARGIAVLGIAALPADGDLDLGALLPGATNSGCAERVWAARRIAADRHLVAVDLSSFRCGQDASVQGIVDDLLGDDRPVLRLHDVDEHRPGISARVRLETFVGAVRRHERSLPEVRA